MKKVKSLLLLLVSFFYISTLIACNEDDPAPDAQIEEEIEKTVYNKSIAVPLGGNTFQTAGSIQLDITDKGIAFWDDPSINFSVFVFSDSEMTIRLDLEIIAQGGKSSFTVKSGTTSIDVELNDKDNGILEVGEFKLSVGYNEFEFSPKSKSGSYYAEIMNLIINFNDDLNLNFVKDDEGGNFYWGRRGPSVHMNYNAPTDRNFEWFYNELMVPMGDDPIGSYFMANGFSEGYFGIQVNSETERRVLFSVWSPFETDDPDEIPDELKIQLIRKGENVTIGEFGNEGSGGQSYMSYNWKPDVAYKFLNSVTPDGQGNTIYTGYFMDPSIGEWMLLASFLRPSTDTWYTGQYSFLENFLETKGHISRSVEFNNQWMFDTEGNPVELTSAMFTGDNIANISYRLDFSGGIKNNSFFLKNCGFFNGGVQLFSTFERVAIGVAPDIDFNSLP